MWKKKLKMKKFQFIVIGLILCIASIMLTCCINAGIQVEALTKDFYKENHADYYIFASKDSNELIKDKIDELKTIKCYKATDIDVYYSDETVLDIQDETYFIVLDDYKKVDWSISPIKGNTKEKGPKKGEVWVQKIPADTHDIKVGDELTIDNENKDKLVVSSLINDSMKPTSMANAQFIYINNEDFHKLEGNEEVDFMIINTSQTKTELQEIIDENFGTHDKVYNFKSIDDLITASTLISGLVTGLGAIVSLFMLIVIIVIIRFFIRSTVINEYSAIGTYKSLGYTTKEITEFYSKCYMIVGVIASVVGVIIGIPSSYIFGDITLEYITKYSNSYSSYIVALLVAIVSISLLYMNIRLSLRKIKNITPVDALRIGTTSSKVKLKKSLIKNASSPLAVSINDIFKNKGRSLLIMLVITLSFYISLVFINMCYSFETLDDKASGWVGSPTSHCCVSSNDGNITEDFLNYIDKNKYVDHYVYGSLMSVVPVESLEDSISLKTAWVMIFNTYEDGLYDVNYASGRPPQNKYEIGIDSISLKNSDIKVGDYIDLKIDGHEDSFLITGTYDTVGGTAGLHMMNDYYEDNDIKYMYSAAVLLKDKDELEDFKEQIEKDYPQYEVKRISEYIGDVKESIQAIMIPVTVIIIVIFIIFTLLIITNLIIMNNKEQEKSYGIMKAYGFTTWYIVRRTLYRIGILSSLSLGISILINKLITSKLFWMGLGCDGFNLSIPYTLIFILSGFVIINLITIFLCSSIRKISPKKLMEE